MVVRSHIRCLLLVALVTFGRSAAAQSAGNPERNFTTWATRNALPSPVDAHDNVDPRGIAWIDRLTRHATVLGVGESAHDVHDFLALRSALTRALIEHRRVAAVVMETGLAEAIPVDDWLAGRTAVAPDLRQTLSYGFGDETEIAQGLQWIRDYNAHHSSDQQIHFYGADLPADGGGSVQPALTRVWPYLAKVDPDYARSARARIDPVAQLLDTRSYDIVNRYSHVPSASRDTLRRALDDLVSRFAKHKRDYIGRSSSAEFDWAQRLAEVARQTEQTVRIGWNDTTNPRDRAMAANVEWIASREKHRGLVVVWAHNLHVARALIGGPIFKDRGPPVMSMGQYLGAYYSSGYVAIGTAFRTGGPADTTSPDPQSADAALAATGKTRFGLRLNDAPSHGALAAWLDQPQLMRAEDGYVTLRLRDAYDALLFVDSVSTSKH